MLQLTDIVFEKTSLHLQLALPVFVNAKQRVLIRGSCMIYSLIYCSVLHLYRN